MVGFVAACCWGGGFLIGSLEFILHENYGVQISLFYQCSVRAYRPQAWIVFVISDMVF